MRTDIEDLIKRGKKPCINRSGDWNGDAFLYSVLSGAFSSYVSYGIGEAFAGSMGLGAFAMQTAAHSASQAALAGAQGGNVWQAAATGAVSSVVGEIFAGGEPGSLANMALTTAGGGVAGGLSSAITGGNFWEVMKTGLIVAGLNHAMHMGVEAIGGPGDPPDKMTQKIRAYEQYAAGKITKREYILAVYLIDENYWAMAQELISGHGVEAAATFFP